MKVTNCFARSVCEPCFGKIRAQLSKEYVAGLKGDSVAFVLDIQIKVESSGFLAYRFEADAEVTVLGRSVGDKFHGPAERNDTQRSTSASMVRSWSMTSLRSRSISSSGRGGTYL